MSRIENLAKERILILDGAMGSLIQNYNLKEEDFRGSNFLNWDTPLKGNNDILNITRPAIIEEIHGEFLLAGADIIETNTFNSQSISMADYSMEDYVREINIEGARVARKAADKFSTKEKPRFVAGAIGPTNRTLSLSPDVNRPDYRNISFDELSLAYQEQVEALIFGGVDAALGACLFFIILNTLK